MKKRWIACSLEETYFKNDRKMGRKWRKEATQKDRSKFKKSDQDQLKKGEEPPKRRENCLRGRVLSISPGEATVDSNGQQFVCTLRGTLKQEKGLYKNLIAVGDFVLFTPLEGGYGTIEEVEKRKSELLRAEHLSQKRVQLIAANIDLVLITASIVSPPLKPALIDRYLIASAKGGMEGVILINKIDLLKEASEEEQELLHEALKAYKQAGITCFTVSTASSEGLDELKAVMKDKASVFSGQSGTGKSSLINAVTGLNLKIGSEIEKTRKGTHTTTTSSLIPLEAGGFCIDTPGIRSFGLFSLKKEEIEQYFHEIYEKGKECRFRGCTHREEPACAVLQAAERGEISQLRLSSYHALLSSVEKKHLKR